MADGTTYVASLYTSDHTELRTIAGAASPDLTKLDALLKRTKFPWMPDQHGGTPLTWAAQKGNLEVVKRLLCEDAAKTINCRNNTTGSTALHFASQTSSVRIVELLLENGAKPSLAGQDDPGQETPLTRALGNQNPDMARAMLKYADAAAINIANEHGNTALHFAAWRGYEDIIRTLLERGATGICTKNKSGETSLTLSAGHSHFAISLLLISRVSNGAELNHSNVHGSTPLHFVAERGNYEVAKALIQHGARPSLELQEKNGGETPLTFAVGQSRLDIAQLFIENCSRAAIRQQNKHGNNALHFATWKNHAKLIPALLEQGGVDQIGIPNENKENPLTLAVYHRALESVRCLVRAPGVADHLLIIPNRLGNTPLHIAAMEGHDDILSLLLSSGAAKALTLFDGDSRTPLQSALATNHMSAARLLIAASKADSINLQCATTGDTALHQLAQKGNEALTTLLLQSGGAYSTIIANHKQETPLLVALKHRHFGVAQLLIEAALGEICHQDADGNTPLHYAAREGNLQIVELLMQRKAEPSIRVKNASGQTPLALATAAKHEKIVKRLQQA
jgi:ankyrin repeat protein